MRLKNLRLHGSCMQPLDRLVTYFLNHFLLRIDIPPDRIIIVSLEILHNGGLKWLRLKVVSQSMLQ